MSLSDVGPTRDTFAFTTQHSATGRITALAAAPNGSRLYAGSFAGVWRSDDGGQNWQQMVWPQPAVVTAEIPGALFAPNVYDVAISPADADTVLVSALNSQFSDPRDGIYRSTDAGATWTLVLANYSPCNIAFAPDDASLVFAAVGYGVLQSTDGGVTWTMAVSNQAWHVAVGPMEAGGVRRVYSVGDSVIYYSPDGGATWYVDAGVATINASRSALDMFRTSCNSENPPLPPFGQSIDIVFASGAGARVLAIEPANPARVYMATEGAANGPTYYDTMVPDGTLCNTMCARLADEASLWLGDFSQFSTANPAAEWIQLPGPPVYVGNSTPSGVTFVLAKPTSSGFLLFFSDCSHVHVSAGTPTATTSWHRLDGEDVSAAKLANHHSNVLWVHMDPHGLAFTSDFEITLAPAAAPGLNPPYNQNSVLSQYIGGKLWMANDGGVVWCADGGKGPASWNWPLGLNTIDPVNIAGLYGIGDAPALYFGCGDNDDFFSRDGGASWGDPGDNCGDCDSWFTDTVTTDRVLQFLPRQKANAQSPGSIGIIVSGDPSQYPDASDPASKTFVPSTQIVFPANPPYLITYAQSGWVLEGYRPIVQTLVTEAPLPDGDYVFVNQDLNTMVASLVRTQSIRSISQVSDWLDPAKATVVGPPLPANAFIVQVSGGHQSPVFYVGDGNNVWKLDTVANAWTQIVPNPGVGYALMWFVNPYDPEIYVLDNGGVKVSADGGQNWLAHTPMTNALTAGGSLAISGSLLQDMQFCRLEPETRFAVGRAGVVCSMDFGFSWFPVLNSIAVPGIPESGFFDPVSNPFDRAFYVECQGRSVLRIGNLPNPPSIQPSPIFDLMEFAALDY